MNHSLIVAELGAVDIILYAVGGFFALLLLVLLLIVMKYGKIWFQAYMSKADVKLLSMVAMGFMKVNQRIIVDAKIRAKQSGLNISDDITTSRLTGHYLAGGNVMNVLHALIASERAGIDLDFDRATAIDLAGRDVREAVQTSVRPKVIDCPDPERSGKVTLSAIAKDGVELKVRTRVTVRTNLEQLIGGAVEATIIARVGESIISSIGSADNPDRITKAVLARGLDAQTAFEIVSIDIADIDVGENIGARLQADQAEADTRVAQARAELRRAEAVAVEQEMKARVVENRSQVIEAEAEVPVAMAEAFRAGQM
jgi:uncharacterized protein YqfA (UPF0365 family)